MFKKYTIKLEFIYKHHNGDTKAQIHWNWDKPVLNLRIEHQNLQVVGEMENLWSYNDHDGRVWSDILAEGPGGVEEMEDMYIFE